MNKLNKLNKFVDLARTYKYMFSITQEEAEEVALAIMEEKNV